MQLCPDSRDLLIVFDSAIVDAVHETYGKHDAAKNVRK